MTTMSPEQPPTTLGDFWDWCDIDSAYTQWTAPKHLLGGQRCLACGEVDTLYRRLS